MEVPYLPYVWAQHSPTQAVQPENKTPDTLPPRLFVTAIFRLFTTFSNMVDCHVSVLLNCLCYFYWTPKQALVGSNECTPASRLVCAMQAS